MHYKKYRNKLTHIIELSNNVHYKHLFDWVNTTIAKFWNSEWHNKLQEQKLSSLPDTIIDSSNKLQSNCFNIRNAYNKYFANVAVKMAEVTPRKTLTKPSSYLASIFIFITYNWARNNNAIKHLKSK